MKTPSTFDRTQKGLSAFIVIASLLTSSIVPYRLQGEDWYGDFAPYVAPEAPEYDPDYDPGPDVVDSVVVEPPSYYYPAESEEFSEPTDLWTIDTDNDGLSDGEELSGVEIIQQNSDVDGYDTVGYDDYDTANFTTIYVILDPEDPDFDDDEALDGWEVAWGSDPTVPYDYDPEWLEVARALYEEETEPAAAETGEENPTTSTLSDLSGTESNGGLVGEETISQANGANNGTGLNNSGVIAPANGGTGLNNDGVIASTGGGAGLTTNGGNVISVQGGTGNLGGASGGIVVSAGGGGTGAIGGSGVISTGQGASGLNGTGTISTGNGAAGIGGSQTIGVAGSNTALSNNGQIGLANGNGVALNGEDQVLAIGSNNGSQALGDDSVIGGNGAVSLLGGEDGGKESDKFGRATPEPAPAAFTGGRVNWFWPSRKGNPYHWKARQDYYDDFRKEFGENANAPDPNRPGPGNDPGRRPPAAPGGDPPAPNEGGGGNGGGGGCCCCKNGAAGGGGVPQLPPAPVPGGGDRPPGSDHPLENGREGQQGGAHQMQPPDVREDDPGMFQALEDLKLEVPEAFQGDYFTAFFARPGFWVPPNPRAAARYLAEGEIEAAEEALDADFPTTRPPTSAEIAIHLRLLYGFESPQATELASALLAGPDDADADSDGIADYLESFLGLNFLEKDSDGDETNDLAELTQFLTHPLDPDTDIHNGGDVMELTETGDNPRIFDPADEEEPEEPRPNERRPDPDNPTPPGPNGACCADCTCCCDEEDDYDSPGYDEDTSSDGADDWEEPWQESEPFWEGGFYDDSSYLDDDYVDDPFYAPGEDFGFGGYDWGEIWGDGPESPDQPDDQGEDDEEDDKECNCQCSCKTGIPGGVPPTPESEAPEDDEEGTDDEEEGEEDTGENGTDENEGSEQENESEDTDENTNDDEDIDLDSIDPESLSNEEILDLLSKLSGQDIDIDPDEFERNDLVATLELLIAEKRGPDAGNPGGNGPNYPPTGRGPPNRPAGQIPTWHAPPVSPDGQPQRDPKYGKYPTLELVKIQNTLELVQQKALEAREALVDRIQELRPDEFRSDDPAENLELKKEWAAHLQEVSDRLDAGEELELSGEECLGVELLTAYHDAGNALDRAGAELGAIDEEWKARGAGPGARFLPGGIEDDPAFQRALAQNLGPLDYAMNEVVLPVLAGVAVAFDPIGFTELLFVDDDLRSNPFYQGALWGTVGIQLAATGGAAITMIASRKAGKEAGRMVVREVTRRTADDAIGAARAGNAAGDARTAATSAANGANAAQNVGSATVAAGNAAGDAAAATRAADAATDAATGAANGANAAQNVGSATVAAGNAAGDAAAATRAADAATDAATGAAAGTNAGTTAVVAGANVAGEAGTAVVRTSRNRVDEVVDRIRTGGCFLAGTLVSAERGQVAIETIQRGERVWSRDVATGELHLCRVVTPLERAYYGRIYTIYAGADRIEATGEHPFWVVRPVDGETTDSLDGRALPVDDFADEPTSESGRWVAASQLKVGDRLWLQSGQLQEVKKVDRRVEATLVYNLHVERLHNYFVGDNAILSHNTKDCTPDAPDPNWRSTQAKPPNYDGPYNPAFTTANAKVLRESLDANGHSVSGLDAHHIVASTHTYISARRSRALLDRFQIDINSHLNGAPIKNALHHGHGLHSHKGMDEVFSRINEAQNGLDWKSGRQAIIDELSKLRTEMVAGMFAF